MTIDDLLDQVELDLPRLAEVGTARAQLCATAALVLAIRELTNEVRDLVRGGA